VSISFNSHGRLTHCRSQCSPNFQTNVSYQHH